MYYIFFIFNTVVIVFYSYPSLQFPISQIFNNSQILTYNIDILQNACRVPLVFKFLDIIYVVSYFVLSFIWWYFLMVFPSVFTFCQLLLIVLPSFRIKTKILYTKKYSIKKLLARVTS